MIFIYQICILPLSVLTSAFEKDYSVPRIATPIAMS